MQNDKAQLAAIGEHMKEQLVATKADRVMEIFELMSPHKMAETIVDQQDYLRDAGVVISVMCGRGSFKLGDRVRKTKGSRWQGKVVGTYSTSLTPEGYAVESETEHGSVQIYPASALELVK